MTHPAPDCGPAPSGEPRFDPEQFRFDWETARKREFEWDPGRRVRIHRPPAPARDLALVWLVVFVPFGLVFGFMAAVTAGATRIPIALLAALGAGIVISSIFAYLHRENEVLFDWERGLARFRLGRRERTYPLRAIRRITLNQRRGKHTGGGATSVTTYACEVVAETDEGKELVARSEFESSPVIPQRRTAPMAIELAEALGLPAPSPPALTAKDRKRHERSMRIQGALDEARRRNSD